MVFGRNGSGNMPITTTAGPGQATEIGDYRRMLQNIRIWAV